MNVDEEKDKQIAIREGKKPCDHVGYWVGFGMNILPVDALLYVITSQNCMMCGEVQVKMSPIDSPLPQLNKISAPTPKIIQ